MDAAEDSPSSISRPQLDWLEAESARWQADGLVDEATRARILACYRSDSGQRRGLMALVVVAVLMCGIGLLLLIGYNWNRIAPTAKIAGILGAVAAAFGGAAVAYARGRVTLGEALAFAGTLAFGNGIWLIAQVLHIRGHFPDAFFWVAIGALATGFLVRSTWAGVQAAVVFFVWIVTEATFEARPLYVFMPLWPLTVVLAYRLGSPAMLVISALTAALWIAVATSAGDTVLMPAAAVLAGCVLHAVGRLSAGALPIRHAWQAAGLVVLLVTFMPLMTTGAQQAIRNGPGDAAAITIAIGVAVAAVAATLRRPSTAADGGVALVACTVTLWAIATAAGIPAGRWAAGVVGATLFSVLALTMAVTLIRSAFGSDRTADLAFGVLFALGLLILRWLSVLENLLLSGMFLLAAGGGLLVLARLWLTRHQVKAARGGAQ